MYNLWTSHKESVIKLWIIYEQVMSKSQTKCEQVVHEQLWARHKQVVNKSLTTYKQLMNKSQAKCEQIGNK